MASQLVMTGATPDEVWPLVRDCHYSRRMPGAVMHCFAWRELGGLFGDTGTPLAAVIFGIPANTSWPRNVLELQRLVRRNELRNQLSELVAWSLRWLRANTETPFVISYADTAQEHHGGIYQATGWKYIRLSKGDTGFRDPQGNYYHGRSLVSRYGTRSKDVILGKHPDWTVTKDGDKHLYIFPLRQKWKTIARQRGWECKPYPKPNFAARPLDEQSSPLCEAGATPAGRSNIETAA